MLAAVVGEFLELFVDMGEELPHLGVLVLEFEAACLCFLALAVDAFESFADFLEMLACHAAFGLQVLESFTSFAVFALGEVPADFVCLAFQLLGVIVFTCFA